VRFEVHELNPNRMPIVRPGGADGPRSGICRPGTSQTYGRPVRLSEEARAGPRDLTGRSRVGRLRVWQPVVEVCGAVYFC
jgi:hypothetical protein